MDYGEAKQILQFNNIDLFVPFSSFFMFVEALSITTVFFLGHFQILIYSNRCKKYLNNNKIKNKKKSN